MADHVVDLKVEVGGGGEFETGVITGTGKISIEFNDFMTAGFTVDYSSEDKVIVGFTAEKDIKISAESSLTISGSAKLNFSDLTFSAGAAVKFEIDKSTAVQIQVDSKDDQFSGKASVSLKIG